jgi:hypothetical protein
MKFWTGLRWFAALAFLALLLWSCWVSDGDRSAGANAWSRPSVFNF